MCSSDLYFVLVALFIISLYNFAIGIGNNYDRDLTIDNKKIDLTSLEAELNQTNEDSGGWQTAVSDDAIDPSFTSIILFSIWGVGKLMIGAVNAMATIYLEASYNVLGIDPMVLGTLVTILVVLLIFSIWKMIKTGD